MPPRDANIDMMIDELTHLARGLTEWEIRFLEYVSDQWERERQLSPEQYDKLKEIYEARV